MAANGSWSLASALDVTFTATRDRDHPYAVAGLAGWGGAAAAIVAASDPPPVGPALRCRPVVEPAGPFDLAGILYLTPYREAPGQREPMIAFEARIAHRYCEFLAAVRWRYAAACAVEVIGLDLDVTAAEVYSIDAADRAEAEALDASTSPEPPDIAAFYDECRDLKVPGSGHRIWLLPPRP